MFQKSHSSPRSRSYYKELLVVVVVDDADAG